jgi:hypothetical protein
MANQHVTPHNGMWQVKRENASRATKVFQKKSDAVSYAHDIAKRQQGELVIHDRNGRIIDKDSFGNDPCPPKDKVH